MTGGGGSSGCRTQPGTFWRLQRVAMQVSKIAVGRTSHRLNMVGCDGRDSMRLNPKSALPQNADAVDFLFLRRPFVRKGLLRPTTRQRCAGIALRSRLARVTILWSVKLDIFPSK